MKALIELNRGEIFRYNNELYVVESGCLAKSLVTFESKDLIEENFATYVHTVCLNTQNILVSEAQFFKIYLLGGHKIILLAKKDIATYAYIPSLDSFTWLNDHVMLEVVL